ncbi:U-box domain-containing protein 5-like [Cynara cardunculus var. scolymus]|uniref:U-box domain-containing protein 5-like n=1 Tax=Cynara cardunculus var. scolymus TaxID=59895 RepID=UPI000D628EB0|nr:U-box domain-containing protein 5-like [Cynara cardunculus var. scolymus]
MHHLSCLKLEKIVDNVTAIRTAIESARPRGQSGILALCSLHQCLEKCKLLLRHCSNSSKLYLAISGERIIWRCERLRYSLEACLSQLQDMVEPKLATQISHVVDYIKTVAFTMDSADKEAAKVLLSLLQRHREASSFADLEELNAFKFAAFRLQITSPMVLTVEKQSIKDLLSKIQDTDPTAKKILNYLLYLVGKYGESIVEQEPETISNESNEEPEGDDDVSIESSDTNSVDYVTDSSTEDGSGKIIHDKSESCKSRDTNTDDGTNLFVLRKLSVLPWALRCKAVEDVINELTKEGGSRSFVSTSYIKTVFKFLKGAHRLGDSGAKRNGAKLLLLFLNESRSEVPPLPKEAMHYLYYLFLDLEIVEEALPILELLSCYQHYSSEIVSSGLPSFLLELIKNPNSEHHNFALRILCNLSAHTNLGDHLVYLGFIQHLVPFLDDYILSAYCVKIFRNLCTIEEAAAQLIGDENCIESIGDILDQEGKDEEQENALHILLCLCHQHEELRDVLMQESIVSSLVDISQNGSCGGKLTSMKLLKFLNNDQECSTTDVRQNTHVEAEELQLLSTDISVS